MATDQQMLNGALEMMCESLESYANEGGLGGQAIEDQVDADAFAMVAMDLMLETTVVFKDVEWMGEPWDGWV